MAARDYDSAPVTGQLSLDKVINGLVGDLEQLRAGQISINDAMARSMLAKQIFNGVRIYLSGANMLAQSAREVRAIEPAEAGSEDGQPS